MLLCEPQDPASHEISGRNIWFYMKFRRFRSVLIPVIVHSFNSRFRTKVCQAKFSSHDFRRPSFVLLIESKRDELYSVIKILLNDV